MEPQDERFVESFKDYMELLVEESRYEIIGKGNRVSEKHFEKAAKELLKESEGLEIQADVKRFVEEGNDLARHRVLAPMDGDTYTTPFGNSVKNLIETLGGFKSYFEHDAGMVLWAGLCDFDGRLVVGACLGEAQRIKLSAGPDTVVFTKMAIDNTYDRLVVEVKGGRSGQLFNWTDYENIYHILGPHLRNGHLTLMNMNRQPDTKQAPSEIQKLEQLAWSPLFNETKDKAAFVKQYAVRCIEEIQSHERYHFFAGNKDGSSPEEEAAAQLHSMASGRFYSANKGNNPFESLRLLYFWKNSRQQRYVEAANVASGLLAKEGYDESMWRNLEPDGPDFEAASSALREKAGKALGRLEEKGYGMTGYEKAWDRLDIKGNYKALHDALDALVEEHCHAG